MAALRTIGKTDKEIRSMSESEIWELLIGPFWHSEVDEVARRMIKLKGESTWKDYIQIKETLHLAEYFPGISDKEIEKEKKQAKHYLKYLSDMLSRNDLNPTQKKAAQNALKKLQTEYKFKFGKILE